MSYIDFYFVLPVVQIVCDFDWEMDDYEVCMEFVVFCFDAVEWLPVKGHLC